MEINWLADGPCTTTFHYDGVFAEHLARVDRINFAQPVEEGAAGIPAMKASGMNPVGMVLNSRGIR